MKNVSLNSKTVEKEKGKFKKLWPQAKAGLTLLKDFIKNPIIVLVLSSVISIGDSIFEKP
jgi:hypothetical protein